MSKDNKPDQQEPVGNHWLLPVAVFAGLCVIAAAVFFGLRSQRAETTATTAASQAPDLSLDKDETTPWVERPPGIDQVASVPPVDGGLDGGADAGPPEPAVATGPLMPVGDGAFRTQWLNLWTKAAEICKPTMFIVAKKDSLHLELPLELRVAPSGAVTAARRFGKARDIGGDGSYAVAKVPNDDLTELTRCYAEVIIERVRFAPADEETTLRIWVPLNSAGP